MPKFGLIWATPPNLRDNLYEIAIILVMASILAISVFSIGYIGSAYAQDELPSGFIPNSEFDSEGNASQQSPSQALQDQQVDEQRRQQALDQQLADEQTREEQLGSEIREDETTSGQGGQQRLGTEATDQTPLNSAYAIGYSMGIVIGSNFGQMLGMYHRDSGQSADPTIDFQQPTDQNICSVLQDFLDSPAAAGTVSQNATSSTCDQNQEGVRVFFSGFTDGYIAGYTYGHATAYNLDQTFPSQTPSSGQSQQSQGQSQTQQPGQSQTQQPGQSQLPLFEEAFPEGFQ